jgi:mRNA interferase RelE/StbE
MQVIYLSSFLKDLKKTEDKVVLKKVKTALLQLKDAQSQAEIKQLIKLKGHPSAYRIRIGSYRMGLFIEDDIATVARFVKRNDIYKLFP